MNRYLLTILCLRGILSSLNSQVLAQDSAALVALYAATSGAQWTNNTNWLKGPVSGWYGVTTQGNRVVQLNLWNNGLSGSLPEEIGNLTAMRELNLGRSNLAGPIPQSIGRLTGLNVLHLRRSGVQGQIPDSLGFCVQLSQLYLGENRLEGEVPFSLAQCKNIYSLHLNKNNLSGTFPEVVFELPNLLMLEIGDNAFSGPLPGRINQLVQLEYLTFSNNRFEGPLPKLDQLTNLKQLFFDHNRFWGNPDTVLGYYPEMIYCSGNNNLLNGLLSEKHFNPQKIVRIDFAENEITELGDFSNWGSNANFINIVVIKNNLDFDDLARNAVLPSHKLWWYPQDTLGRDTTIVLQAGAKYVFSSTMKNKEIQYTWLLNDKPISGASGPEYTLERLGQTTAGKYAFHATHPLLLPENPIRSANYRIALQTTSTPDLDRALFDVTYMAIPGQINIVFFQNFKTKHFRLFNANGQLFHSQKMPGDRCLISVERFPAGIYFIDLKTEKGGAIVRILKR